MDVVLNPFQYAEHELVEQFGPANVVRVSGGEKDGVSGCRAVLAYRRRPHERDDDVEEERKIGKREDEHLVGEAALPLEVGSLRLGDRILVLTLAIVQQRRIPARLHQSNVVSGCR